ncbi:RNA polymerase sigma-70 factor (ECF subfamily) [Cryobacterium mesophilum]|uniref:Anti-sigma factor n=1 Tax=Terrimesophilobacter mesophilus TaxID=433647 RepID=A0A4R8VB00_9MICO|nr:zf-HC2 domain-containing protein [Terrimesophilobacter mesophilus]MBB5632374.1 RNA polymerase sigma-70 factor (ECF subfamily) [Terrimesophilobacter mesophilus]TFB79212.1 anti-sigma factor [Terrimesophilobacter mesophilus]
MIDTYRDWDAAYLLGALPAAERREFEDHLSGCAACRSSVAELAGIPGLLARVPLSELEPIEEAPQDLLPRLVGAARRHRVRVRALTGGIVLAAAAAAVAVTLILPQLTSNPAEPAAELTLSQVVPSTLSAEVQLVGHAWGTSIDMTCSYGGGYGQGAATYALYVTDTSGKETQLATWTAEPGRTVEPSGTTSLALKDIRSVDVRAMADGTILLAGSP